MRKARAALAMLVLAAAGWGGGGTKGPAQSAPARRVAQQAKSDADLEKAIRAKFAKSKIHEDNFQVHVQGGIATIEGKTDVLQHKGVATRLAKSGGAAAVVNRIQISDAARQKAAKNLETGRRRAQIKRGDARSEAPSADRKR